MKLDLKGLDIESFVRRETTFADYFVFSDHQSDVVPATEALEQ